VRPVIQHHNAAIRVKRTRVYQVFALDVPLSGNMRVTKNQAAIIVHFEPLLEMLEDKRILTGVMAALLTIH